jgi:hypothetical protein
MKSKIPQGIEFHQNLVRGGFPCHNKKIMTSGPASLSAPPSLLVLDDDPNMLKMMRSVLEKRGSPLHVAAYAALGGTALALLSLFIPKFALDIRLF